MSFSNISHVEKKKSTIADVENCVKCWNNGKYIHSPSEIILSFFQVVVRGLPTLCCVMRKPDFAYAKTKPQISCAVTAQLISDFVFAIWVVQFLFFFNRKFQASSRLLWLHRLVCV